MLDSRYQPKLDQLFLKPLALFPWARHWPPLFFTLTEGAFGILTAICIAQELNLLAFILLLLSAYLGALDGPIARFQKRVTKFGMYMSILIARLVESAILFSLFLVNQVDRALFIIILFICYYLYATTLLFSGVAKPRVVERAAGIFFFSVMILLPKFFIPIAFIVSFLVVFKAIFQIIESQFLEEKVS